MGKRKEIKFLCKDGQTREGRQDGVMFWIRKDQKREQDGLPAFYVAANDIKGKGRTIYTAGHEYFTLEGAKELCQQIMAGEANLAERKARYAAEDMEKERRVAAQQEMETALRWASVDNRPLYNRYRHTKKKRIRKKYAKRILEWYRTEVAPC